jgi:hypothetical protein
MGDVHLKICENVRLFKANSAIAKYCEHRFGIARKLKIADFICAPGAVTNGHTVKDCDFHGIRNSTFGSLSILQYPVTLHTE